MVTSLDSPPMTGESGAFSDSATDSSSVIAPCTFSCIGRGSEDSPRDCEDESLEIARISGIWVGLQDSESRRLCRIRFVAEVAFPCGNIKFGFRVSGLGSERDVWTCRRGRLVVVPWVVSRFEDGLGFIGIIVVVGGVRGGMGSCVFLCPSSGLICFSLGSESGLASVLVLADVGIARVGNKRP